MEGQKQELRSKRLCKQVDLVNRMKSVSDQPMRGKYLKLLWVLSSQHLSQCRQASQKKMFRSDECVKFRILLCGT